MDIFWAFLMVLASSGAVFLTAYYVLKNFSEKELHKKQFEVRMKNQSLITPIRLQAYERLVLFLERIQPNSLIMRTQQPNQTVRQLQSDLHGIIRAEFEHNLSQQVYISSNAWEIVKSAKENTIKIINSSVDNLDEKDESMALSKEIISKIMEVGKSPSDIAIEYLKKEVQQYF